MTGIGGLIERGEQATGGDRELDFDLMCLWNSVAAQMTFKVANAAPDWYIPPYTASIDAALALVERRLGAGVGRRISDDPDGFGAQCDLVLDNGSVVSGRGQTWPLAIILATLRALRSIQSPPKGDA